MTDTLITFEIAKLAREKGFNLPCKYYYEVNDKYRTGHKLGFSRFNKVRNKYTACSAPTQSLLQAWLREEHGIQMYVYPKYNYDSEVDFYCISVRDKKNKDLVTYEVSNVFPNYEFALELALAIGLKAI